MIRAARTQFDQLIERIHYPADRRTIIDFVREHGKGDDVVTLAETLANKTYANVHDIHEQLEKPEVH